MAELSEPGRAEEPSSGPEASGADVVPVCSSCGRIADDPATAQVTWARGRENGGDVWTCDQCSRTFLRSIEGKLDSAWW